MTERRLKRQFGAKASTTWIQKRLGVEGWLRRVDRGRVAAGTKSPSSLTAGASLDMVLPSEEGKLPALVVRERNGRILLQRTLIPLLL